MKKFLLTSLAMFFILLTGCSGSSQTVKITFSDQDKALQFERSNDTLAEALEGQGYDIAELKQRYQPSIGWDQKMEGHSEIELKCKCKVSLKVAGSDLGTFESLQPTVGEVLKEKKVALTEWDEVNMPLDKKVVNGTNIVVDRIEQRLQKKVEEVPFNTKEEKTDKLADGKKEVEKEGKEGKKIFEVLLVYKNGKPVLENGKPKATQRLVKTIEPVDKIVKIGTNKELAKKDDVDLTAAGTLTVEATGYTHTGSRTATGTYPKRGTIAVDPDVIPLGTKLYIPGYGYGVAEDTGGAVNGKIIDLFFETRAECIKWGRRTVTIKILK
ncbi:3D domain-containing protein [Laceyella putida]|uniref:3D domain-containing protein n=1 Tax=Laceyella putida TaxID=110101 RepID=A0ABW2RMR1_9BACL